MKTKYGVIAIAVWATLAGGLAAGERAGVGSPREAADPCCLGSVQLADSFEEFVFGLGRAPNCGECDPGGSSPQSGVLSETVGRAGGWFANVHGSQTMIGQYQELQSAPCWDLDHLYTDGLRTEDFFATGTDAETSQVGFHYAGPGLRANVEYDSSTAWNTTRSSISRWPSPTRRTPAATSPCPVSMWPRISMSDRTTRCGCNS